MPQAPDPRSPDARCSLCPRVVRRCVAAHDPAGSPVGGSAWRACEMRALALGRNRWRRLRYRARPRSVRACGRRRSRRRCRAVAHWRTGGFRRLFDHSFGVPLWVTTAGNARPFCGRQESSFEEIGKREVWLRSVERKTRFELATLALARRCSTAELLPREAGDSYAAMRPLPRGECAAIEKKGRA